MQLLWNATKAITKPTQHFTENDKITAIKEKLERLKEHKIKYETLQKQIDESGELALIMTVYNM